MTRVNHAPSRRLTSKPVAVELPAGPDVDRHEAPLIRRFAGNPLLTSRDIPGGASCVFNSGVVRTRAGYVMLVNAWGGQWEPRFMVGRSRDGLRFDIDPTNRFAPPNEYPYVEHEGIFDTRITPFDDHYLITYNVASRLGGRIRLARTDDFNAFEDLGFITQPDHRNCVIFPERVNGDYLRLERPNVGEGGDIYLSRSRDLVDWGRWELVLEHNARYWESAKVGAGAPPIRTAEGWLCIYHAARKGMNGYSYQAGAMLLDLENPAQIRGKMNTCLLEPQEDYERVGITPNVVFPTAAVRDHERPDQLRVYYGSADTCMALATINMELLVRSCLEQA